MRHKNMLRPLQRTSEAIESGLRILLGVQYRHAVPTVDAPCLRVRVLLDTVRNKGAHVDPCRHHPPHAGEMSLDSD